MKRDLLLLIFCLMGTFAGMPSADAATIRCESKDGSAETLLPLLEGRQEFWAMGEFVHLGESVLPVLTKALTMPGPRVRYNAIETMSMIKAPGAVPALLEAAKLGTELPGTREHALRVAVRLDPQQAPPAI